MTTNSQEANTQTTQRIRAAKMKSKIGTRRVTEGVSCLPSDGPKAEGELVFICRLDHWFALSYSVEYVD